MILQDRFLTMFLCVFQRLIVRHSGCCVGKYCRWRSSRGSTPRWVQVIVLVEIPPSPLHPLWPSTTVVVLSFLSPLPPVFPFCRSKMPKPPWNYTAWWKKNGKRPSKTKKRMWSGRLCEGPKLPIANQSDWIYTEVFCNDFSFRPAIEIVMNSMSLTMNGNGPHCLVERWPGECTEGSVSVGFEGQTNPFKIPLVSQDPVFPVSIIDRTYPFALSCK